MPAAVGLHTGFQHVEVTADAPVAIRNKVVDRPLNAVNTPFVGLNVDGHVGAVDDNGLIRGRVVRRQLGAQVIAGVAPAQLVRVNFDPLQRRVIDVDAGDQRQMTIHRSAIFTDAIVFTRSGSSTPCEKLNQVC